MAVYVGGLVVQICPAFETGPDVAHDGAVPMADAIVVLIPLWDLVIRKEAVRVLDCCLNLGR